MQGWKWGLWVQWCLALGGSDFCKLCLYWNRLFNKIIGRNPTFIGVQPEKVD